MGGGSPESATQETLSQGGAQHSLGEQELAGGRKSAKDRLGVRRSEVVEAPKEEEEGDSGGSKFNVS